MKCRRGKRAVVEKIVRVIHQGLAFKAEFGIAGDLLTCKLSLSQMLELAVKLLSATYLLLVVRRFYPDCWNSRLS